MSSFWRNSTPDPPEPAPEGAGADEEVPDWQAELGREHGLTLRAPRRHRPDPADDDMDPSGGTLSGDGPINWQAELLRERAGASPDGALGDLAIPGLSSGAGFDPAMVPKDFKIYKAMVHKVFDPARERLAAEACRQPAFESAFRVWRPGQIDTNLNVLYVLYERIAALMGRIYRFHPAPMGYAPDMTGVWGLYNFDSHRIMLSQDLLLQPVGEVFATIIHEQVHKLQHEMQARLTGRSPWPLTLTERALAYYWVRELGRLKWLNAVATLESRMGRGQAAYRRIGIEYHAYDTEEYVVPRLTQAFGRKPL